MVLLVQLTSRIAYVQSTREHGISGTLLAICEFTGTLYLILVQCTSELVTRAGNMTRV